jgi:hypothetical protein
MAILFCTVNFHSLSGVRRGKSGLKLILGAKKKFKMAKK